MDSSPGDAAGKLLFVSDMISYGPWTASDGTRH
jgi:hypothetical protein